MGIGLSSNKWFLPRRAKLSIKHSPKSGEKLEDVFIGYQCLDCDKIFTFAQAIVDHQKTWHGWRCWFKRLMDS